MTEHLTDVDQLPSKEQIRASFERIGQDIAIQLAVEVDRLGKENDRLRTALTGVSTCSTCEACRGAALRALGGQTSLEAKIGALLIGRGFYDRMKDQTDEDTAARIVHEFLAEARPIVSQHFGRTQPPGDGQSGTAPKRSHTLLACGDPIPEGGCGCRRDGVPIMRAQCFFHGSGHAG